MDGETYQGSDDTFIVKYNSSGSKQWTKLFGTSGVDHGRSIFVNTSDDVFITGYTRGGLDGNSNQGSDDIFIVKYNSDGVKQ